MILALFAEMEKPITKFIYSCKGPRRTEMILKKGELEASHFLILKFTTKLQKSTQCGINLDILTNERNKKPGNKPLPTWSNDFDKGAMTI